ncbi:hypothetical protein CISG_10400 [Coccidioides immitis RMSCC 3703]|uniref:Uncharacterized protein n=1 Tax=Coccidioides immitis RMSCC 3703 TaxID=454286 RepID=A0A0J8QXN7_COCIT|nr:hypothetical protein CISG_10400 [Coccidioides immitis RMSCC 3703]
MSVFGGIEKEGSLKARAAFSWARGEELELRFSLLPLVAGMKKRKEKKLGRYLLVGKVIETPKAKLGGQETTLVLFSPVLWLELEGMSFSARDDRHGNIWRQS